MNMNDKMKMDLTPGQERHIHNTIEPHWFVFLAGAVISVVAIVVGLPMIIFSVWIYRTWRLASLAGLFRCCCCCCC